MPFCGGKGSVIVNNFIGQYDCKMDAKGRIIMPARFREKLTIESTIFVITRGLDNAIDVFTKNAWDKYSEKIEKLSYTNPTQRGYKRFVTNDARELEFDSQGRMTIPKSLITYADLKKEIIVTGFGDRIQIWDKEKYEIISLNDLEIMNNLDIDGF